MNNWYLLTFAVVVSLLLNVMIAYGIEDKNDAKENNLINELIKTGKFTEDEAKELVTKVMLISKLVKTGKFTEDEAKELVTKSMQNDQEENQNQNENQTKTKTKEPTGVFKSKAFTYAQPKKFETELKGDNEIPPVNTTGTGKAKFTWHGFKVKDDAITSRISVSGITNMTGAHIYKGAKVEIGQPIVDLLKSGKQNKTNDTLIIKGDIKVSDFEGLMKGKTLEDLRTALASEGTYVNIQTSDHPDGEIRGQIKVSGSNATQPEFFNTTSTAGTEGE